MPSTGLRIGRHKLDIRFWREDARTEFEVVKGDPDLVERCDVASKLSELWGTFRSRAPSPA